MLVTLTGQHFHSHFFFTLLWSIVGFKLECKDVIVSHSLEHTILKINLLKVIFWQKLTNFCETGNCLENCLYNNYQFSNFCVLNCICTWRHIFDHATSTFSPRVLSQSDLPINKQIWYFVVWYTIWLRQPIHWIKRETSRFIIPPIRIDNFIVWHKFWQDKGIHWMTRLKGFSPRLHNGWRVCGQKYFFHRFEL